MKKGIIYCATSPDGKKYYGRTIKFLSQRKGRHILSTKRGSNLYFHNAIRKYGELIKWEVVEWISEENKEVLLQKLNEREIFYIQRDNTLYPNGYNLTKGGGFYHTSSNRTGKTFEEIFGQEKAIEIKEKQSKNNSHYWKDKQQPKAMIEKRVNTMRGRKQTQETKQKIANSLKGQKFSDERKQHISQSLKGKPFGKNFGNKTWK